MDAVAIEQDSDVDATERDLDDDELTEPFTYAYIRTLFRESLKDGWPRYELQVPDRRAADGKRRFLVCCPTFRQRGMAGRGTRGYAAFDLTTERFVWLKDAWRSDYLEVETEGDILSRLNKRKISNVPTLVCHGDIHDQVTETPNFWHNRQLKPGGLSPSTPLHNTAPSSGPQTTGQCAGKKRKHEDDLESDCPHRLHRHYRLVVEEVCMPLHKFIDGAQLLSIVRDCIRGKHIHCVANNIVSPEMQF